eukprot:COSAG01_NODE_24689_length_770_cov_1.536513_2_plen_49_part_00
MTRACLPVVQQGGGRRVVSSYYSVVVVCLAAGVCRMATCELELVLGCW